MTRKKFVCLWCQKELSRKHRTRDHITPKAIGGSNEQSNIAIACRDCNEARGLIMSLYKNKQYIERLFAQYGFNRRPPRRLKRLARGHQKQLVLGALHRQRLWVEIERHTLGYAPSNVDLILDDRILSTVDCKPWETS